MWFVFWAHCVFKWFANICESTGRRMLNKTLFSDMLGFISSFLCSLRHFTNINGMGIKAMSPIVRRLQEDSYLPWDMKFDSFHFLFLESARLCLFGLLYSIFLPCWPWYISIMVFESERSSLFSSEFRCWGECRKLFICVVVVQKDVLCSHYVWLE